MRLSGLYAALWALVFILATGLIATKVAVSTSSAPEVEQVEKWLGVGWTIYLALFGLALVLLVLAQVRRRLFPMVVFAIGQGKTRHQHQDLYRLLVLGSVTIPLIIGIALAVVF